MARRFEVACALLWGDRYQLEAARQLKLSRSSIVRYANGEYAVPSTVWDRLGLLLHKRRQAIGRALADLPIALRAACDSD